MAARDDDRQIEYLLEAFRLIVRDEITTALEKAGEVQKSGGVVRVESFDADPAFAGVSPDLRKSTASPLVESFL